MSIVIYNPTNENFDNMMYGGKTIPLPSGEEIKVDDVTGKHLLNAFTVRGLCSLEFGDDKEKAGVDGIARNLAFKKKRVMDHNHRNVMRKQQGMSYTDPTPEIRVYAKELGVVLDEPYALKDRGSDKIRELEDKIGTLQGMLETLLNQAIEVKGKKGS